KYGAGYLDGYELNGLFAERIAVRDPKMPVIGDIIDCARRNTDAAFYPTYLLELLSYEGDKVYLFDTRQRSTDGEWPVVCINAGSAESRDVARSFAEFLLRHL